MLCPDRPVPFYAAVSGSGYPPNAINAILHLDVSFPDTVQGCLWLPVVNSVFQRLSKFSTYKF